MVKNMGVLEKYYIKTRGIRISRKKADEYGIRRVYNYTSDVDFMTKADLKGWIGGLYSKGRGEATIVESALKYISGVPIYISTCIVFRNLEMCNVFYLKNYRDYSNCTGFLHLHN